MPVNSIDRHNNEIHQNAARWDNKPLLQKVYKHFYSLILEHIDLNISGDILELGSGIGNIKSVLPNSISSDIFPNPWIDRVENAYQLNFNDNSISHVILFDVFHHLEYPGNALNEIFRVLEPNGRLIIFDPYISCISYMIYGTMHPEPIGWFRKINWQTKEPIDIKKQDYYAAQGNATRIFFQKKYRNYLNQWEVYSKNRYAAFYYLASGGYSGTQLYPKAFLKILLRIDKLLSSLPWIFGSRALVVLKKSISTNQSKNSSIRP